MEAFHDDFKVGECEGQKIVDGEEIPLVLNPASNNDVGSLVRALEAHKIHFEETMLRHTAILLRGFDVSDAEDFNRVVEALNWDDMRYVGPALRTHVHGRVWTANEGPLSEFLYFHHEMVTIKEFPTKLMLFCEVPPPEGGETPLVTSWRVTERMQAEFPEEVKEMEEKGLRYSFIAPNKNDTRFMRGRGWEETFGTSDPFEAERRAKASGIDIEWLGDGAAKTILGPRPVTQVFPGRNGRRMWFNTIVGLHGKGMISSAEMADGSEIPGHVVKRCEEIIEEESIQFRWEKGDILFLDNLSVMHGRRPSLPPRRILIAIFK